MNTDTRKKKDNFPSFFVLLRRFLLLPQTPPCENFVHWHTGRIVKEKKAERNQASVPEGGIMQCTAGKEKENHME
jgi:hypothetical protein